MQNNCTYIPYHETGNFSKLVLDYLEEKEDLRTFYKHHVSLDGIKAAIAERKRAPHYRSLLVQELETQYAGITLTNLQEKNLKNLIDVNTFTICTAHQPNIFTGHLYFIYKILHAIKLCQELDSQLPDYNFVPVFYMGSEDADLDELGHINLNGEKLEWKTTQTGAVGRMKVDNAFINLIERLEGQLSVLKFGKELIQLFKSSYTIGTTIQQATLLLVNELFRNYGLLVLIPDNANLKTPFNSIIKRELTAQFSQPIVQQTSLALGEKYKVQAAGRDINLFYLVDDSRERITLSNSKFEAASFTWTNDEIITEVDEHPERFSCNVILRGVFQEMILPNIAFVGGGGEIAYWLQLKDLFEVCEVPFPMLVLRNSFLLIEKKEKLLIEKLGLNFLDIFKPGAALADDLVKRDSKQKLKLDNEVADLQELYQKVQKLASAVDITLSDHVINLQKKAQKAFTELEKKMLRAERKNFDSKLRQLNKLKNHLFPSNNLQERIDNFSPYYAVFGEQWLELLLEASQSFEKKFCVVEV
jgi:bacillithiol biosynthesis cysteine-adding enzyme BshC